MILSKKEANESTACVWRNHESLLGRICAHLLDSTLNYRFPIKKYLRPVDSGMAVGLKNTVVKMEKEKQSLTATCVNDSIEVRNDKNLRLSVLRWTPAVYGQPIFLARMKKPHHLDLARGYRWMSADSAVKELAAEYNKRLNEDI